MKPRSAASLVARGFLPFRGPTMKSTRKGQVLLEFALVAVILFLLLALILDFGRGVYAAQVVEQAADTIARELAVTPLPPDQQFDFEDTDLNKILSDRGVYSEDFLIIDITKQDKDKDLLTYLREDKKVPSGNLLLVPLMLVMDSTQNPNVPAGSKWLVYPGAIVKSNTGTSETGFRVKIPLVKYSPGAETIEDESKWLPVVFVDPDKFKLSSSARGQVVVQVNYPFQAAAISGRYRDPSNPDPDAPPKTPQDAYIEVTDDPLQPGQIGGPYSGKDGLGQQAAFTKTVRPFRRIVSGQGVYRREIFQ